MGLDSGTGNGKYLPLPLERPTDIWTIGLDRSRNLLNIAQAAGGVNREVVWGDALGQSWREGAFVRLQIRANVDLPMGIAGLRDFDCNYPSSLNSRETYTRSPGMHV